MGAWTQCAMPRNNKKVVRSEHPPAKLKDPRRKHNPNKYRNLSLSWKLSSIDLGGRWGWSKITPRALYVITQRLKELENKSLHELEESGSHEMACARICNEAQQRLRDIYQDDTDHLFSFRVNKTCRIWGILDGNVVIILWYDPNHGVYPMNIANN